MVECMLENVDPSDNIMAVDKFIQATAGDIEIDSDDLIEVDESIRFETEDA